RLELWLDIQPATMPQRTNRDSGDIIWTPAPRLVEIIDVLQAIRASRDPKDNFLEAAVNGRADVIVEAALSAVGVVELVHGVHRADTAERRARREAFIEELL